MQAAHRAVVLTLVGALVALVAAGCSTDDPPSRRDGSGPRPETGPNPDGGGPPPGKELSFVKSNLDIERAGEATAITSNGARVGIAYYRNLAQQDWPTIDCPVTITGGGGPKPRPGHDLYYVQSSNGGVDWGQPVKVDQTISSSVYGISAAMGSGGTVYLGYLGGEMSQMECSSSDAVVKSSADGTSFSQVATADRGTTGDTVGHWTSVAIDKQGQPQFAYRDVHFGFYEQDGNRKASLRYGPSAEPIVVDKGAGVYAMLRFDNQGRPVIMHYNPHEVGPGGGIQLSIKAGTWTSTQLVAGATAQRPSLATDGSGRFGVAFYEPSATSLKYIESTDLAQWTTPLSVDLTTDRSGEFASLAFDSNGNPAISYYRCGRVSTSDSCKGSEDALMLAYRIGGKWKTWEVDTGGAFACGDQSSLAFNDSDEPVIAYRCVMLRNQDNQYVDSVKVARGVWQ